ncbi:uncharacterized protein LOC143901276 [Temnothorax americanus]|uniref:uncharacterized protein LOC143901276 n=1 Tax=Temnothorax americanus TaxID=1964332 RepID=UPI0040691AD9
MPRNEHYQNDILYITQPTRNILLALGVWPSISKEKSVYPKTHNLLLICISYILFSSDLIPGILYWVLEETTRIRLQIIPLLLYDLMSASSYGIFIFRYDQLRRCLKHIEEDWENVFSADARNIMLKSARTGKRLVTICGVFMYSGVITFRTILPLSQGKIVTDQNVTLRHFACPGYFFSLDVQVSPVYETVFVIQSLTGFITVSVVTGACGLTAIFVVHACGQLKILINLMRSLVQERWREEREVDEKIAEIVEHQVRVRNFLRLVQHTLQEIYLMEILVNTIAICLLVYFMLVDWQNKNITTLCTYVVSVANIVIHIFLFCYTGEQLSSQAEKVAIASCELEWYRLPDRNVRSVVLLMIVSNAPTKISAGKFMDLSLRTFGAFLAGMIKYTITVAICSLAALLVMHICGQLEILMALTDNMVNEMEEKQLDRKLTLIVEHQIRMRNFLKLAQSTLEHTSLMEVLGCTIILCFLGHDIIMEWKNQNVISLFSSVTLLTSLGFNIYIFCFIGEQLFVEGEKLALTVCTLDWYRLPNAKARSLVLVIAMSIVPTKIRAGKFFDLTIRTFGDIVKTIVTYVNFIRKMMD